MVISFTFLSFYINIYKGKLGVNDMAKIKWSKEGYKRILEAQERGRQTQREKYRKIYFANPKKCLYCGEIIPYKKRRNDFCSQKCSAIKHNFDRGYKSREKFTRPCKGCGKIVFNKIYCSIKCQRNLLYKEYIERWLSGREDGFVGKNKTPSNYIRAYVMERANYQCEYISDGVRCCWNFIHPVTKKYVLHLHHKDGNFTNNKPENLMVLCPNHHYMTENMGALNKGNGRKIRNSNIA